MRILFVSDTYYPHVNGVYYFVCRLGPLLQARGHEVAVMAPSGGVVPTRKIIDGIEVFGLPSVPIMLYPGVRVPIPVLIHMQIRRRLRQFKPDIIHIQDHFLITAAVIGEAKKSSIPVIGTNHFMAENLTALFGSLRLKKSIERMMWSRFSRIYNQLSVVTTPTETAARLIRPRLEPEVIAVSSGIDLYQFTPWGWQEMIRKKYAIPDKPVLLFVGRLDPEKHIEEILYGFALSEPKIQAHLVIVGKGISRAKLELLVKELCLTDKVTFTGFVPESDLPGLYNVARCFIIASIAELLSLATLQAMASALPVIAVRAGALPELVRQDMNGFLFNPGDIGAISEALCQVFLNDHLQAAMSQKSLEYIREHDIKNTVESFERIYKQFHTSRPAVKVVKLFK